MKKADGARAAAGSVADYKRILQRVLDNRPAGTRLRLAETLGKNRSFISQITNPGYSVPIPARHIEHIFETCHFLAAEREQFMKAYHRAHPNRAAPGTAQAHTRELVLRVPDFRDAGKNKALDDLLRETLHRTLRLLEE